MCGKQTPRSDLILLEIVEYNYPRYNQPLYPLHGSRIYGVKYNVLGTEHQSYI